MSSDPFLCGLIEKTEALIDIYYTALTALGTNSTTQSYTLDTGQDKQTVTRADIGMLNKTVDGLIDKRDALRARCGIDSGVNRIIPGF